AEIAGGRVGAGRPARAPVRGRLLRRGDGRLRRPERGRPRTCTRGALPRSPAGRPARHPRDHDAEGPAAALLPALVRRARAAPRQGSAGGLGVHVPPCVGATLPRRREPRRPARRRRLYGDPLSLPGGRDRGAAHRRGRVSALASIRAAPGLDAYLDELEERLDAAVGAHGGLVSAVGAEALAAGGKRLRPLLVCLARGEALQRRQRHDPDTSIDAYLERCALKTGKLFEAACGLGRGGLGAFGLSLGIAFQITDDILDCSGETIETGKVAGTDLREGTPTLPLLLAAREDAVVRRALAGGPLDGALVRVAATSALARSRELAQEYALRARA